MKSLLIAPSPSISILLECAGGELIQTCLSLPEDTGFTLLYDPAETPEPLLKKIIQWLTLYAARTSPPPLSLDYSHSSPFTQAVLAALQTLPFGTNTSYAAIAEQLSYPRAARAIGNACGSNPFPLLIPCHRVLASGQKLGGFSCGIEIKKRLLTFEEIPYKEINS